MREMTRIVCWGGDTWVFLDGGVPCRVRDVMIGDSVLTATGEYRAVVSKWVTDYTDPKRNTELVRLNGVWMTSHHPVLVGDDWYFPADLAESHPAPPLAAVLGPMFNFELAGHLDTIVLAGDGDAPAWPLTGQSCSTLSLRKNLLTPAAMSMLLLCMLFDSFMYNWEISWPKVWLHCLDEEINTL
eukprot:SAG31_NODE_635_length_13360_cov_4.229847_12_plen_185_part_00